MAEEKNNTSYNCDLAQFIGKQFDQYRDNRATLEDKWQRNIDAFKAISTKFWKKKEAEEWRSNTFVNKTKEKIMAAYSIIIDMLLVHGRIPFTLKPSLYGSIYANDIQVSKEDKLNALEMEKIINQQMSDCNADRSLMTNVLACAIYGETYAKRIIKEVMQKRYVNAMANPGFVVPEGIDQSQFESFQEQIEFKSSPGWDYISVWDIFRDMETDDLTACASIIQRQMISAWWLRNSKGKPYFIDAAIDNALKTIPHSGSNQYDGSKEFATLPPALRDVKFRQNTQVYLEFWGRVPSDIVEDFEKNNEFYAKSNEEYREANENEKEDETENGEDVEIMACVVNGLVVRFARTKPSDRPFYRAVWEANLDGLGGISVADNAEPMQLTINGAVRAFEDNKKLTANLLVGIKRRYLENNLKSFTPGQVIDITDECDDVRKALQPIEFPDVGESLMSLIALCEKFIDMETMIPNIMQGQGVGDRTTAYEISQQVERAGKYMAGVIRNFDEGIIEPIVESFYEYNMKDPTIRKGKGNYVVKATGFNSFQDRIQRINKIQQYLAIIATNPQFAEDIRFRQLNEDIAEILDMDTDKILKTEEEKQVDAQNAMNSPDMQLAIQERQSQIEKTRADAQSKLSKADMAAQKLVIDRAKAVAEIQNKKATKGEQKKEL